MLQVHRGTVHTSDRDAVALTDIFVNLKSVHHLRLETETEFSVRAEKIGMAPLPTPLPGSVDLPQDEMSPSSNSDKHQGASSLAQVDSIHVFVS